MDSIDAKLPGEKKNKKKKKPTLRFELDLPDSTGTTCPEYSYIDLVRTTLKEKKSKGENDIMCQNLLEEEEEKERNEAEAMAKYFEIKYGATAAGHKHKRKDKVRDLVGAGYGYDENDPFVDDSEAYDEIVPATLTTQHGGFYINTGQLNFRAVSDQSDAENSSSDDTMPLSHHITKKKKKKRHANLLETDESENEFKDIGSIETKKRKKKLKPVKDLDGKKKRKISINGKDKVTGLKKSKKIKKPTSLAQKLVAKAKAQQMMSASVAGSPVHQNIVSQNRKNSAELIRLGNKDLAQVAKQATRNLMNIGLSNDDFITEKEVKNGVDVSNDLSKNTTSSPENHELPPNLPQMLGDKIESLKKIAKSAEGEGKLKFFNNNVNRILLGIEESSQGLRTKERQGMYQHIAQHLPCSKDTLLKRVKKLQVNDSDQQLKGPIGKLKAAVDAVMTSQIEAYVVECDAKSDKFFDKSACAASTDEDEECEEKSLSGTLDGTEAAGEKVKRTYAPRRKFKWDDNLRKLLCDVVTVKMSLYERFKVREKQNPEEYLKAFLETTIKPLWPKPWMQTRILFKESRSAHHNLTFNSAKQKKTGSYKKVLGSAKDSNKAADIASGQKYVGTLNNSAGQSDTTAKSFKKQLIYETNDSKNYKPSVNAVSSRNSTTYSTNDKIKIGNLTSGGGFELVASIESENSPTSSPLSTQKKAPPSNEKVSTSSWKASNTSSIVKTKMPPATMLNPGSTKKVDKKLYSDKTFNRSFDSSFSSAVDVPLAMSSQAMESYASDIIKFMMDQNQLAHANPVYHGSPGLSNYDAISKILGLSPNDVLPKGVKNSKQDEKLKFKISSAAVTPSSASKGGFPKLDVGTKRVATAIGPSWSSQNPTPPKISKPDKVPSIAKQKVCPPTSTAPVYSVTFDDKHAIKNLTMRPIPNFAVPSISSSNFSGQRSRSNQHHSIEKSTVSPNTPNFKIAQSAIDNLANIHNVPPMSPTFPQNTKRSSSTPCSVPIPKLQYSPSGASNIKLESIRGGFNPMLLSSMASSFNPNTNSFSTAYSSSSNLSNSAASKLKTMPVSSARNFPENYSMTDPQFSKSFPLVNLVDIQGNDSVKQAALNLNIKANQNR
ncbi:uncharacterized protein LOC120340979 [Styela clava]